MFVSFFRQSAVTCNGGMKMASWMDLVSIPVSPGDKDDEAGLQASVQRIHALVDGLVEKGIPAERVIIGGYVLRSSVYFTLIYIFKYQSIKAIVGGYASILSLSSA